jgi:hypothetical protein
MVVEKTSRDVVDRGDDRGSGWPGWVRGLVSTALGFHLLALLAAVLAAAPASDLERAAAGLFAPYHQLIDQGHSYRYYAPEPGPTPVVTARLRYSNGREEVVRLPERGVAPRLRYQRQLALANHLAGDYARVRQAGGRGIESPWARSFARHLSHTRGKGCASVVLFIQSHLAPDPLRVVEARTHGDGRGAIDLDAEEFYTTPERIGEFPCDGL